MTTAVRVPRTDVTVAEFLGRVQKERSHPPLLETQARDIDRIWCSIREAVWSGPHLRVPGKYSEPSRYWGEFAQMGDIHK